MLKIGDKVVFNPLRYTCEEFNVYTIRGVHENCKHFQVFGMYGWFMPFLVIKVGESSD